jgi:hypothetical protein
MWNAYAGCRQLRSNMWRCRPPQLAAAEPDARPSRCSLRFGCAAGCASSAVTAFGAVPSSDCLSSPQLDQLFEWVGDSPSLFRTPNSTNALASVMLPTLPMVVVMNSSMSWRDSNSDAGTTKALARQLAAAVKAGAALWAQSVARATSR